jgi:hypothetical protein
MEKTNTMLQPNSIIRSRLSAHQPKHAYFHYPGFLGDSHTSRKGDALNIDDYQDFKELVVAILASKPEKISVFVDMADIQKA